MCFQFRDTGSCRRSSCKYEHVVSSPDPPLHPLWGVSVLADAEDPPCPPRQLRRRWLSKKIIISAAERLKRGLDRLHLQRLRRERQLEFEVLNFMRNLEAESAGESSLQELLMKVELGSNGPSIPKHFGEAMSSPYRSDWRGAIQVEYDGIVAKDVFELVNESVATAHGQKILGTQWVFDLKRKFDGSIERFKARLVHFG